MTTTQPTLDQKISQIQTRIATIEGRLTYIDAQIPKEVASYKAWVAANNYDEAHRHSDASDTLQAEKSQIVVEMVNLKETLSILQEQKAIQLNAQTALVNQANASANATNSQSNLSPEQQLQLQLAKLENERANSANKMMTETSATQQAGTEKAKTTRNYIIAGIVSVVVIIVVYIMYKKK